MIPPEGGESAPSAGSEAAAREAALEVLRRVLRGAFLAPTLRAALDGAALDGRERSFVTDLCYGTMRYLPRLDAALAPHLRAPDRLPERARAALRLAAYEMLHREDIPPVVSINEAVDIAKRFSTQDSGKFVNGILDKVKGELMRPARIVK